MIRRPESPLTRATALVAACCVLLLTVLAASPDLHAGLHAAAATGHAECDHAGAEGPVGNVDHSCAVTLLAQGAAPLLFLCLLLLARPTVAGLSWRATDEVIAARPRFRHAPAHAPPAA